MQHNLTWMNDSLLLQNAGWGIALIGVASDRIDSLNPAFAKLYGHSDKELLGRSFRELAGPELPSFENTGRFETDQFRKDGSTFVARIEIQPVCDASGKVIQRSVNVQDITESRNVSIRLREMLEDTQTGYYDWDVERGYIEASETVLKIYGIDPAKFKGTPEEFYERVHPADVGWVSRLLKENIEAGRDHHALIRVVWPDQSIHWLLGRSRVRHDKIRNRTRITGTTMDLTDQVRAQEAIARSEKNFRTLAENLPQIVWATDAMGRFTYANNRWFEYSGLDLEATEKEGWQSIVHADDLQNAILKWDESRQKRTPYETELRVRRSSDGSYRWHLCRAVPLIDEEGLLQQWFGTWTDIEDQKRLQQQRETLLHEARETIQLRDEFVSVASHELKTPLASLLIHFHLLKQYLYALEQPDVAEKGKRAIDRCEGQTRRITVLVEELLDLAQIRLGRLKLNKVTSDFAEIIRRATEQTANEAGVAGKLISIEPSDSVIGLFDSNRVAQIVNNLLSNSIKYGEGRPVSVRTEKAHNASRVRLIVEDHGMGIPAELQTKIFERFERAVSGMNISGLGLGLYIVRRIVEAHGGTIRVVSEVGKGAKFTVELPLE